MSERAAKPAITTEAAETFTDALGSIVTGTLSLMEWGNEQGIPAALGLTPEEWALRKISGHPRLSIAERRQVVSALSANGLSQREIAATVGVGVGTVNRDLDVPNGTKDEETPPYDADFSTRTFQMEQAEDPDDDPLWWDKEPADPAPPRPRTPKLESADPERDRREEVTRRFVESFSLLSSLLLDDRDQIAESWEASANRMAHIQPLAHLWTADGIRDVARRLERLADEVDKRGGKLG